MKANEALEYALKVKDYIMETEQLNDWRDFDDQKIFNLTNNYIFPVLHETMRVIMDAKYELEYRAAQSAGKTGEKQRTAAAKNSSIFVPTQIRDLMDFPICLNGLIALCPDSATVQPW